MARKRYTHEILREQSPKDPRNIKFSTASPTQSTSTPIVPTKKEYPHYTPEQEKEMKRFARAERFAQRYQIESSRNCSC